METLCVWAVQRRAQLKNTVPSVGQISNRAKIEQALLREGVPTDVGFASRTVYMSLQP